VSTDDDETANIASSYGAEVPFMRPKHLADDFTGTISVIKHAINFMLDAGVRIEKVCCIYATAPFVAVSDIVNAMTLLDTERADYAFGVTSFSYPIQRALSLNLDGRVEMLDSRMFEVRSQDCDVRWHDAAQFYWGTLDAWMNERFIFRNSIGVKLPRYRVQDIDTEEDWIHAEAMYAALSKSGTL
jgi:N-acylneuraminate cytidylyltransferase